MAIAYVPWQTPIEGDLLEMMRFEAAAAVAAEAELAAGNPFSFLIVDDDGDDFDEDVGWSVNDVSQAQEDGMRNVDDDVATLKRGPKEEEEKNALKLRDYIDQGKKLSKVLAKAEKLFRTDRVVHGILAAAVAGESKATVTKSVLDVAIPHLKTFGMPMEADAQNVYLAFLDIYGQDESLLPAVPNILKTGFDEDILEEEHILQWHRKDEGSKDVREKTKAVNEWLETAQEESYKEETDTEEKDKSE